MRTYFKNISVAISSLVTGLGITLHHFRNKKRLNATLQYPNEKWPIPERNIGFELTDYNLIRSRLHVDIDDCIGCMKCVRACPVDCIVIDTIKVPKEMDLAGIPQSTQTADTSGGTAKKLLVTRFDIDMAECCYCNLCVFPCPEECIYMVGGPNEEKHEIDYEFSVRNRNGLVYEFSSAGDGEVADLAQLAGVADPRAKRRERREQLAADVSQMAEAVDVSLTDAAPAEAAAQEKPKKKAVTEPSIDFAAIDEIGDKVVRGLAKRAATIAVRAGKDAPAVAGEVKAALEAAGKLNADVEAAIAKLAEATIERPGDEEAEENGSEVAVAEGSGDESAGASGSEAAVAEGSGSEAPAADVPAAEAGAKVDLKILNGISDRVARGKAKAILTKVNRQGGSASEAAGEIRAALEDLGKLDAEAEAILAGMEA
ncbi:MAG: 4Fe-4S binding protein [Candidatus Marinimicrobia bacterium]|nr:4Fe-4S binding protein [Candidatus Neomarinimicrobiota bacterium]